MRNSSSSPAPAGVFDRVGTLLPTSFESGTDIATIALWLCHETSPTTEIYLHAYLALKERAIQQTAPPGIGSRRYRPPDRLLAFLEAL